MITEYDQRIKSSIETYLPGVDWRLLKAQLQTESSLNPNAISEAGAMGLAQFMPNTWSMVAQQMHLPDEADPFDPNYAIPACAFYMRSLMNQWSSPRPDVDRYCLALASYNAGLGNLLTAQKRANMALDYYRIIHSLPSVTGRHAIETMSYVPSIFATFTDYLFRGR